MSDTPNAPAALHTRGCDRHFVLCGFLIQAQEAGRASCGVCGYAPPFGPRCEWLGGDERHDALREKVALLLFGPEYDRMSPADAARLAANSVLALPEIAAALVRERGCPDDIRAAGWTVAAHNDYRLHGAAHTFWLFTKDGRAVKGEGYSDAEALDAVRVQIASLTDAEDAAEEDD